MKKLLLITKGFPFGESERSFLLDECEALIGRFSVFVLTTENTEPLHYPMPELVGVESYQFSSYPKNLKTVRACVKELLSPYVFADVLAAMRNCSLKTAISRCKFILGSGLAARQIQGKIREIVEREKIDIIYTYWCTRTTLAAIRLKKEFPRLRVVTRFHGADLYNERQPEGYQAFRRELSDNCDRLVFACEAGKNYYLSQWGQQWQNKAVVAYLGSRGRKEVIPGGGASLCLISCSNLIPLKRVEYIIEALALLPEDFRVDWHHFGDGPLRETLEAQARQCLGSRGGITWKFWGYVPNEKLAEIYGDLGADLFITTSSTEGGAPVSIQEAQAMAIPCVATAVGGIPELVISGKTGFLLPDNPTVSQVKDAIKSFSELSWEEKANMRKEALSLWKEKLDAVKNGEAFAELLASLVDGQNRYSEDYEKSN